MKKLVLLLLISLCLVGCDKKKTIDEPVIKTELTEDEKTRIIEIDAEIAKHLATKNDETAKCRAQDTGGSNKYIECINKATNKFNNATKDIIKEKQDIEATIGTIIETK